jgi:GxxExxY protein
MVNKHVNLLYEKLSYQIRGVAIEVKKNYGPGHKEVLYQRAFAEELSLRGINYEREKAIKIYSPKTQKVIGSYQPDFIIDSKIIVELKALEQMPPKMIDQIYSYLRNSEYELGFFINYASRGVDIKRVIYTNDRKKHLQPQTGTRTSSQ